MKSATIPQWPMADPVREVLHGIEVEDPFRWLEDQESPETRSFIQTERRIYHEYLDCHKELRREIERRVSELLTVPSVDLPVSDRRGGLLYLKREAEQEQKAIYYQDEGKAERLLISIETLGSDSHTSIAIIQVSPDGRYLVFGMRTGGEDVQEIGIYDFTRQEVLPDRLPRGFYRGLIFNGNQSGFYYVHEEAAGEYQVRRAVRMHRLGDDQSHDREIYHAGDGPALRLILLGAEDASALGYLLVSLEAVPMTRFLIHEFPLSKPPEEIIRLANASIGVRFSARWVEASTTHAAPRGRITRISLNQPEERTWSDIIPEAVESLHSWEPWADSRVIHYTAGIRKLTRIYSESGKLFGTIEYPVSGTSTLGQVDGYTHRLFYSHSDITEPPTIYEVDLITGEHRVWWQQSNSIRQEAFPEMFKVESHTYGSKDGTEIPITLIHPRSTKGHRPVLLSAYGGGGASSTQKFSVLLTILVEAGFTCATAHVRGGGEGGLEWHLAAQKERKQTSVDDLLFAARFLIANGYTTEKHLGVAGQSYGALLVLCALTQSPDRFRAALALGPVADLTRFHLFGVARGFAEELGSPDDPGEFAALYRLSPYHHVRQDAHYPAVLVISGDRDKRCDALHARKMVARLRDAEHHDHPVLLDYTETRGHKPVLPLAERIRALTDRLTFLIAELEMNSSEALRP